MGRGHVATRTETHLIDDTNGEPADETVTFAVDGTEYEIDLTAENAQLLRDLLASWISDARKAGRPGTRPAGRKPDYGPIREWARANGYTIGDKGRVPQQIQDAYANRNKAA